MDRELEAAIDSVGRERVFALMEANGWHRMTGAPKWTWWLAVEELRCRDADE